MLEGISTLFVSESVWIFEKVITELWLEIWGPIISQRTVVGSQESIGAVLGLPGYPQLGRAWPEELDLVTRVKDGMGVWLTWGEEVDGTGVGEEVPPVGERGGGGRPVRLRHLVSVNGDHPASWDYLQADISFRQQLFTSWCADDPSHPTFADFHPALKH